MNPELKEKWVNALRSGRYKQIGGSLSRVLDGRECNCCLGVLCRVLRVPPSSEWRTGSVLFDLAGVDLFESTGLDPVEHDRLAEMNDSGVSFSEIADYIEAKL